jgi:Exonuclease VII small subunit.
MASNKATYQQSIDELRQIIEHIESEEISVDELDKKVKRGAKLIQQCKEKLKSTENSVNQVLENLDQYQDDDQEGGPSDRDEDEADV